jgi:hypothetical protein
LSVNRVTVRELEAVLEKAKAMILKGELRSEDLTPQEQAEEPATSTNSAEVAEVTRELGSR